MTEDAIADDKLITIVQVHNPIQWLPSGEPNIETIGCLGRIIRHERLSDGRFNFLLVGRKRVRILEEMDSSKLYRIGRGELLEDLPLESPDGARRLELAHLFRLVLQREDAVDPQLAALLESDRLGLGQLTDIIAHALGFPPSVKQSLLENLKAESRASSLLDVLQQILGPNITPENSGRPFPPDFSRN